MAADVGTHAVSNVMRNKTESVLFINCFLIFHHRDTEYFFIRDSVSLWFANYLNKKSVFGISGIAIGSEYRYAPVGCA